MPGLDMETTIETLDDRIRLQKAIYLSQEAGVPLGYRFSWYVWGPYSPGLTRDYFSLQVATENEPDAVEGKRLRSDLSDGLDRIIPITRTPSDFDLGRTRWLELVSSLHYLLKRSPSEAVSKLEALKPSLFPYVDIAKRELLEVGLYPDEESDQIVC